MNFSSSQKVLSTILAGSELERIRGANRCKVNAAANCVPPLSEEEAQEMGIKINVNWGELMILLTHAKRQLMSAFRSSQNFFTVSLPNAPLEMQADWGTFITNEINKVIRKSLKYFELQRSKFASVVTHGVGPQIWPNKKSWMPRFVSMADLRIPTDTTLDFANLGWFAVRHLYTPMELMEEVFNGKSGNKWDKKAVARILKNYKQLNTVMAETNYDVETSPEKLLEVLRQNGGYYDGDAMPAIPLWHFYFEDMTKDDKTAWFMVVVPETGAVTGAPEDTFLWQDRDNPIAPHWSEIIHCQFGDLSTDPPFKYHAIRGLGYALLEPTFYTNLTRCRALQHVHDNFNIWLRSNDPAGKARAQIQEFANLGVVAPGLSIVPQTERHQIDPELVEMMLAQLKQLMNEASSSYTQSTDTGTKKEQTAFETRVKVEQVTAMLGGILDAAFIYEGFAYEEMCRRFLLPDSDDVAVKKFQRKCREYGIPTQFMDVEQWEVEPVTPLGMGNPTVAQSAAQQLMAQRGAYGPEAQNEILHESTLVITQDPRKAARLVPLGKAPGMSEGARFGVSIFGTLMSGVMVPVPEGISAIEQFEALEPLFAGKIVQMEKRDNMADFGEGAGLQNVGAYLEQLIQILSTDPAQKERVKKYSDSVGKLMNQVKGLVQRGAEAAQKQSANGSNGEQHAKVLKAAVDGKIKEEKWKQQAAHKQQNFKADQRRKDAETFAQIQRQNLESAASNRMKSFQE